MLVLSKKFYYSSYSNFDIIFNKIVNKKNGLPN